ncbi:MAG: hypothetical protein H7Z40_05620 [Phycisphaerae bacterium]|nr:hypothetical protein [Gemmatimonadaceae bacterium]
MEDFIELRMPASVSSIDNAMHRLLITVGTQDFAGRQTYHPGRFLQAVNWTGQIGLRINASAVGSLLETLAEWRFANRVNDQSAHHRHEGEEEDAFQDNGVHML